MKTNISAFTTIAVLVMASAFTTQAASQVYDLKADWSDTQNPNGTWQYRAYEYAGPDLSGNDGYLIDTLLPDTPYPWVREGINYGGLIDIAAITRTTQAEAVSGFLEVGDIHVIGNSWSGGASSAGQAVVRWTAPADGSIDVDGSVWEDLSSFDTGDWRLIVNGSYLSYGDSWLSSRSQPKVFSNGTGGPGVLLNIPVQAGDHVDLRLSSSSWGATTKMGINYTITFTPDAVDPVAAIEDLALAVVEMNLQNGIENSLDSKLDAALNALDDVNVNNDGAACNTLDAFINAVEAQRGNKLTNAEADQLIAAALEIQAWLNCGD